MKSDHHISLASVLRGRQAAVLAAWQDLVLASFPDQTARFLRGEVDPFRNPLGARIREGTTAVIEKFVELRPARESGEALDVLLRIRAVQGQPASQALEFVFGLKRVVRSALGETLGDRDWRQIDDSIDGLALVAFDAYMRCREEILQIRVREAQRRAHTLLSRFAPALDGEQAATEGDWPVPPPQPSAVGGGVAR